MRTVLLILGIWLLLNVLYVVIMARPRKPRGHDGLQPSDARPAPATINKEAYPFRQVDKTSIRHIIISVGVDAFLTFSSPIVEAIDSIKRAHKKKPPTEPRL